MHQTLRDFNSAEISNSFALPILEEEYAKTIIWPIAFNGPDS